MDFWKFLEKLANLMLRYKPSARKYPGDERMRPSTKQSLRQRAAIKIRGAGTTKEIQREGGGDDGKLSYSRGLEEGNPGE